MDTQTDKIKIVSYMMCYLIGSNNFFFFDGFGSNNLAL
jgi:hypothetical protein